jgi:ubiquinone/menaquinone biosynthesis C-methylase UbiE
VIYFWNHPKSFIREIARVLKPNVSLVLTFADKNSMTHLPFVKDRFNLSDLLDLQLLIKDTKLEILDTFSSSDHEISISGEMLIMFLLVKR